MPKMKTRKSVAKRFSATATGKLKFRKSGLRHILTKHSSRKKRQWGSDSYAFIGDLSRLRKCLPYV